MPLSKSPTNRVLILLIVLNVLNIVDRNLISGFGSQIRADLNLTYSQFGYLTGFIFVFFYAVIGLFVGRLADIMHRPRLIAAGLILWSALTMVSGAAKNFLHMAVARLFVGVGEACLTPAAMSMLADLFPARHRGRAAALYYLGVPLGAGASFIAAGVFGPLIGWRNCFYLLGGVGLLIAPLLFFVKDPQRGALDANRVHTPQPPEQSAQTLRQSLQQVWQLTRRSPVLLWTMIGAVFMHLPVGAAQFAQIWLVEERGFAAAQIAISYGVLLTIIGIVGTVFSGIACDWYEAKFKGGRARFLAIFLLCVMPLLISYRFAEPGSTMFYIGMGAGFLSFMAFYGPAFAIVQDLAPARLRGVTVAVLLLAINLFGHGFGALITGVLSDVFANAQVTEPLTWSLLVVDMLAAMTIVSFFIASWHWQRETEINGEFYLQNRTVD